MSDQARTPAEPRDPLALAIAVARRHHVVPHPTETEGYFCRECGLTYNFAHARNHAASALQAEGWAVVPSEPTDAMVEYGQAALPEWITGYANRREITRAVLRAALAASQEDR